METASYIALSRQAALRRQMDIVAHNVANANTHGFRGERIMFTEHIQRSREAAGIRISRPMAYVRDISSLTDTRSGALKSTGNPLDLAIQGGGFFVVETPEGERYTRNGRFQIDNTGQMTDGRGAPVLTEGGDPIIFAPEDTEIVVSRDGTVSTNNGPLGKLRVVTFENEQLLERTEAAQFTTVAENPPTEEAAPDIKQGMLEASNVEPMAEMAAMIAVHRSYDAVKSFIRREDQRQRQMIRDLGDVA